MEGAKRSRILGTSASLLPHNILGRGVLVLGFLAVLLPTLVKAAREYWVLEAGSHSPIVLMTGIWLLAHVRCRISHDAGNPLPLWAIALSSLVFIPAYIVGRSFDLLVVEGTAVFGFFLLVAMRYVGVSGLTRNIFPFLYLAFLIPIPGWVLDILTGGLRHWLSEVAAGLLGGAGLPVSQQGVVINIAQYQLLVEDACSGVNSLIGLTAISLFYVYILHRADWTHVGILLLAIVPTAIIANLVRVIVLILLTYSFGDAVAQGFAHNLAGLFLFAVALGLMVAFDLAIRRLRHGDANRKGGVI